MRSSTYHWLLLFFMLWLPVQGAAAAVLSVCAEEKKLNSHHGTNLAININDDHHHADCHKQTTENPIDHVLTSIACDDTSCTAYGNTPIVPSCAASMSVYKTSAVFVLNSGLISFIPEQPQRPPLYLSH